MSWGVREDGQLVLLESRQAPGADLRPSLVPLLAAAAVIVGSLGVAPLSGSISHLVGLLLASSALTLALFYMKSDREIKADPRYVGHANGAMLFLLLLPLSCVMVVFHSWYLARWLAA